MRVERRVVFADADRSDVNVIVGALLAAVIVAGCASAAPSFSAEPTLPPEVQLGPCGGPIGNVRAAFDLAHARDLWSHIPGFLGAPELEVDDPAHVVVYDRPMQIDITGKPRASGPQTFDHVVCVAIGGDPTYYSSVDLSVVNP